MREIEKSRFSILDEEYYMQYPVAWYVKHNIIFHALNWRVTKAGSSLRGLGVHGGWRWGWGWGHER